MKTKQSHTSNILQSLYGWMRKSSLALLVLISSLGFSQTVPSLMNYQGVARSPSGNPIGNRTIGLKFQVLQNSASGTAVFSETQSVQSNALGIFNTQIGKNSGSQLAAINWAGATYFLSVGIDTTGGSTYIPLGGAQQLVSTPYSLYAASAPSPSLSITGGSVLNVGTSSVALPGSLAPNIAISGNVLSITSGSSVVIPTTSVVASATGVTTVTPSNGGTLYTIDTPSTIVSSSLVIPGWAAGIAQVFGTFPNYTISVAPQINYDQNTGFLVLSSTLIPAYSWSYNTTPDINFNPATNVLKLGPASNSVNIAPALSLSYNVLSVGQNNTINLAPITPWRQGVGAGAGTVTLATVSDKVGIGGSTIPACALDVTGFTKLGATAPQIQMEKFVHTFTTTAGIPTQFSFSGITTPDKILSITVMVEMTLGGNDWIHPGYTATNGYEFEWKVNATNNSIDVTPSLLNSSFLVGKNIKILMTYEQP